MDAAGDNDIVPVKVAMTLIKRKDCRVGDKNTSGKVAINDLVTRVWCFEHVGLELQNVCIVMLKDIAYEASRAWAIDVDIVPSTIVAIPTGLRNIELREYHFVFYKRCTKIFHTVLKKVNQNGYQAKVAMSLSGYSTRGFPNSLTGLQNINASDITIDGKSIKGTFVPYTGATKSIDLGVQNITTTHTAALAADLVNFQVLTDAIDGQDIFNAGQFLDKVGTTGQSVVSAVTFVSPLTLGGMTQHRVLGIGISGQVISTIATTTEIAYLSGVTNSIQVQLDEKLARSGSNANQNIVLGGYKVQSTAVPSAGSDYINKTYGDATYATTSGLGSYLPLAGGTMTGNITMNGNFVSCSSDPSSNNQLTRKSYVDTLIAGRVPRTGDTGLIGDYQTSGSITSAGLISTGGIRGSSYTTASSAIEYNRVSDRGKWFKIINLGGALGNTYYAEFHLTYSVAGDHAHIHFVVSAMFNYSPSIKVLHSSQYGGGVIQQLRLSTDNSSIYFKGYVEMYLGDYSWYEANINIYLYGINSAPLNSVYSLVSPTKEAGTSSGFTYWPVATYCAFDYNFIGKRFYMNDSTFYTNANTTIDATLSTPARIAITNGDAGDMISKRYGASGDRYGFGQYSGGVVRVFGSNPYFGTSIRMSLATDDVTTGGAAFTDLMTIIKNGNVGIGTDVPGFKLHVAGECRTDAFFSSGPNSQGKYMVVGAWNGSQLSSANSQVICTNGNVHIDAAGTQNIYLNYYQGTKGGIFSYGVWTHNSNMTASGDITASTVYSGDWFRSYGNGGLYFQNLGYGIVSAHTYDSRANPTTVGNIQCYGTPKGEHFGYNVPLREPDGTAYGGLCFASKTDGTRGGILHTWGNGPGQSFVVYVKYNEVNVSYCGAGSVRMSQDWDRIIAFANGSNTSSGYFYYNQGNAYGTISDARIKKDLVPIDHTSSVAFIKALEPTSFCMKESTCEISENCCKPEVCSCRQDGWIAQNVLSACELSGASKSVINHWYDYEQQQSLPEEERTAILGVSDRPILSHTVNVVKALLDRVESLERRLQEQSLLITELAKLLK